MKTIKLENERLSVLPVKKEESTISNSINSIKESEERYHKMISEVEDYAILLMDTDGTILNWNKGAQKIKGYSEDEIVGKNFRQFYLPEDRANKLPETLISIALKEGKATHEGWRMRKDGTTFWGSVCITALHNSQNEVIGFSKVTRDLTERKNAEEKIKHFSEELEIRNKELEQFAFVASHDLQEPLRKIATFSEMMKKNLDNRESVEKYTEKILSATKRMSNLIHDILNYSKLSFNYADLKPVNLNSVIDNVKDDLEIVIHQKNVKIEYHNLPVLRGIEFQLQQLFFNLISNSIKFSTGQPEIEITSRKLDNGSVIAHNLSIEQEYYEIIIKDNGIGIDPIYYEEIFKPFTRLNDRSFAGSGIGLALCKKIVENHQGKIEVKSEQGKGSTFTIILPA